MGAVVAARSYADEVMMAKANLDFPLISELFPFQIETKRKRTPCTPFLCWKLFLFGSPPSPLPLASPLLSKLLLLLLL